MVVGINTLGLGASEKENKIHLSSVLKMEKETKCLEKVVLRVLSETVASLCDNKKKLFENMVQTCLWKNQFMEERPENKIYTRDRSYAVMKKPNSKSLKNALEDQCHRYVWHREHSPMDGEALYGFQIEFYKKIIKVILSDLKTKSIIYKQLRGKALEHGLISQ